MGFCVATDHSADMDASCEELVEDVGGEKAIGTSKKDPLDHGSS